ncbi:pyruvate:ferredoxin (flavodoxin) oxidoreductase [Lacticaseibacillus baoqingensis]|uniref:Pyruvate:ferredoxin (Flavodoxin) oxidoreductase n=1 Tax=Lacticaseibacillus baoqingensis TaxID=2486013 RepID=A0ABW4E9D4_9LACO|nr:pyruvate:ferredoxin (flavodoxin) oxidoreductase [Lacticaseibacillus baoqingensis]
MHHYQTMDGNHAAAYISYAFTQVASLYPITPSSPMGEAIDEWANEGRKNLFGAPVKVVEMQSEAGASGTVHGSLKTGALTSTYTSSQGLLLMLPNMYKIAGELLPTVFNVAARAVATNALSIFGDHSDVMAVRQSGFCMLCESTVQEVMDLSGVAHLASIAGSLPFVNFFDGFRTSHELQRVETIAYADLHRMLDQEALAKFQARAMNPDHPYVSGAAQNPDIYFQSRETVNQFYDRLPAIVQHYMQQINALRGTDYDLTNYYGDPDATEVIIAMGSVAATAKQTVAYLNAHGRKVGFLNIHLYRPFPTANLLKHLPQTVQRIAVLDRTKEPGSIGEPLLLDVQSALYNAPNHPVVIGGRYGLASKNVTPDQLISVYDELQQPTNEMKSRFTIGIVDDVTHLSLPNKPVLDLTPTNIFQAEFWGFGSDGTVGAIKQAAKLLGDCTGKYVQAYSEYDSKKSSGLSRSYLRFGTEPIDSTYTISRPNFVGCHNAAYLHDYDLLKGLQDNGIFLLNTFWDVEKCQRLLPPKLKKYISDHQIRFYIIDAAKLARAHGLGRRINTVMCTAFFELATDLKQAEFVPLLQDEAKRAYGHQSQTIVEQNYAAIEATCAALHPVTIPDDWATQTPDSTPADISPDYINQIFKPMLRQQGDQLSVKDLVDHHMLAGNLPSGSAAFEKRGIATEVPQWRPENCIECNLCSVICPHAAIRPYLADDDEMAAAPEGYIVRDMRGADGLKYRIQVSIEDCTGCGLCAQVCPAKDKALVMQPYQSQQAQLVNWRFANTLSQKVTDIPKTSVRGSQFEQPLMEFSGACAGCGETGYVKLLTQLFGDRMMIANTTGCSSIWGASAPVTPYTTNAQGQGPAWCNSLFEDNAEFGYGMLLANQVKRRDLAKRVQQVLSMHLGSPDTQTALQDWLAHLDESDGTRQRADRLQHCLQQETAPELKRLLQDRDRFVKVSQWLIGGDGWAYDIGFGGVDHVLASGEDINLFVFDNELYANTGGQMSKATPASAVAKFAAGGKQTAKKDLGLIATTYGNVYVAQVALDANPNQTLKAIQEAENYPGPALIIGYTPCINHGLHGGMHNALQETKQAVASGYWPLYRYDPQRLDHGQDPLTIDSRNTDFSKLPDFLKTQNRFSSLATIKSAKQVAAMFAKTTADAQQRFAMLNAQHQTPNQEMNP